MVNKHAGRASRRVEFTARSQRRDSYWYHRTRGGGVGLTINSHVNTWSFARMANKQPRRTSRQVELAAEGHRRDCQLPRTRGGGAGVSFARSTSMPEGYRVTLTSLQKASVVTATGTTVPAVVVLA